MSDLLEPLQVDIDLPDGKKKTYILSKFPAITGREILFKYPLSGLPKIGDYAENEAIMLKLMSYVAVIDAKGTQLKLSTADLVNNHVPSAIIGLRIEDAMFKHNFGFFLSETVSNFLSGLAARLPQKVSEILTDSLDQLSRNAKPPSTN